MLPGSATAPSITEPPHLLGKGEKCCHAPPASQLKFTPHISCMSPLLHPQLVQPVLQLGSIPIPRKSLGHPLVTFRSLYSLATCTCMWLMSHLLEFPRHESLQVHMGYSWQPGHKW